MRLEKEFMLNSGHKIPSVGLGTWHIETQSEITQTLKNAINLGYRHIDTAQKYNNEKQIGIALKSLLNKNICRNEFFLTTKLWCDKHNDVKGGIEMSLKNLNLDYVDLYLIHYPVSVKTDEMGNAIKKEGVFLIDVFDPVKVWRQMECLVDCGKVKSIGVSNFGIENISKILECCRIKPAIAQFELHPYLQQKELVDFCRMNGIQTVSFSSLGSLSTYGNSLKVVNDEDIKEIAKKYEKSVAQTILSFLVQNKHCVIPRSTSEVHLKENLELFELSEKDLKRIGKIEKNIRYIHPNYLGTDLFK